MSGSIQSNGSSVSSVPARDGVPFNASQRCNRPRWIASAVTLGALVLIEALAKAGIALPNPNMVYLLAVVYCAYIGGTGTGLASAGICFCYTIYFIYFSGYLTPAPNQAERLIVVVVTMPLIAIMVGRLRTRSDAAIAALHQHLLAQNQQQMRKRDLRQSRTDAATGLANRAQFVDIANGVSAAGSPGFTVMVVALDHSHAVNQALVHACNEQILRLAGERIKTLLRSTDVIAYLRADAFALLLAETVAADDIRTVARLLEDRMLVPYSVNGEALHIDIHIGAAIYPDDAVDILTLIDYAIQAMVQAKSLPNERCQLFDFDLAKKAHLKIMLAADLHHALERNELFLQYQPRMHAASSNLMGVEALLRWQHPVHGLVSPLEFIPLAEESGLIVPIGEWVLETACQQAITWRQEGQVNLRMAVNISARQLRNNDFLGSLQRILNSTGMPSGSLELEITESLLMVDPPAAIAILTKIHEMGVRLSIDDFGTGYSSLAYLQRFPIDCLKIDRAFIQNLPGDRSGLAITRAIITLAQSLNLKVVAEGIETQAQQILMMQEGCDELQGYLFGKPQSAKDMKPYLVSAEM